MKHSKKYYHVSNKLNYTIEQKNYNNELTRKVIDYAYSLDIVFCKEDFKTFASIRDRIRCFYKSYSVYLRKKKKDEEKNDVEKDGDEKK